MAAIQRRHRRRPPPRGVVHRLAGRPRTPSGLPPHRPWGRTQGSREGTGLDAVLPDPRDRTPRADTAKVEERVPGLLGHRPSQQWRNRSHQRSLRAPPPPCPRLPQPPTASECSSSPEDYAPDPTLRYEGPEIHSTPLWPVVSCNSRTRCTGGIRWDDSEKISICLSAKRMTAAAQRAGGPRHLAFSRTGYLVRRPAAGADRVGRPTAGAGQGEVWGRRRLPGELAGHHVVVAGRAVLRGHRGVRSAGD